MDVAKLRHIASRNGFEECFYSAVNGVIVFEPRSSSSGSVQSITVWFQSGTVGVEIPHPRHDNVRSFHFNVGLNDFEEILVDPGRNQLFGYRTPEVYGGSVGHPSHNLEEEECVLTRQLGILETEESYILAEKKAIQRRLQMLPPVRNSNHHSGGHDSLEDLERRKHDITHQIRSHHALEKKSSKMLADDRGSLSKPTSSNNNTNPAFISSKSIVLNKTQSMCSPSPPVELPGRFRGNRCMYSFANEEYQAEFGTAWAAKSVNCVAMGRGYLIVYEDGGAAWWDIPDGLDAKLSTETDKAGKPILFAALGQDGNYFVKFINGKMEWLARESFELALKEGVEERKLIVNRVSLGAFGIWGIVWEDGTVSHEGLPHDLIMAIEEAHPIGVRDVTLGPAGEWFLILKDHSVQANSLPDSLHAALATIKDQGGRVRTIVFGENHSWYIRYWDGC